MKRGFLCLLAVVLTGALLTVTVSAATATYPLGDLDFDGDTKASDLTALARAVGGVEDLVNEGYTLYGGNAFALGDVDVNGGVAASDLTALSRHVGGVETLPAAGQAVTYAGAYQEEKTPSEGLEYELNTAGTAYTVVGIGTCTDTDVIIPTTYNGLPVTSIGESAFYHVLDMVSVEIPDSVTDIGYQAFYYCGNLTSVVLPESVVSVGQGAFSWCVNLASIEIPDSVANIGGGAFDNTAYYDNEDNWEDGILYVGCHLVGAKSGITACSIKEGTKTIIDYAFYYNTRLTSIEIPDSVTNIGNYTFYSCDKLTNVDIPDGVTGIGKQNFQYCTGLTSVVIPGSVTSIDENAFAYCIGLTSITFEGTVEEWSSITKGDRWDNNTGNYTVTCVDGTVAK